jgi:hypothetical protein
MPPWLMHQTATTLPFELPITLERNPMSYQLTYLSDLDFSKKNKSMKFII